MKKDIYLNEDYIESRKDIDLYRVFFCKLGVSQSLELQKRDFKCDECKNIAHLKRIIDESKKEYWSSYNGKDYYFHPDYFRVYYAPLLCPETKDFALSKLVWSNILKVPKNINCDYIQGKSGFVDRTLVYKDYDKGRTFIDSMIRNVQKMPATDGTMRLSSKLIYNSEINVTLAGKYLPLIDVECVIDESWESTLQLKKDLTISDLLDILNNISYDDENKEENKERICKIYERIVELGIMSDPIRNKIKEWSQNAKILSKGGEFLSPNELRYITIDGVASRNQVYIGKQVNKDEILKLVSLMGVKIITEDNVTPQFEDLTLNTEILTRMRSTLPALAVLARECNEHKTYQECKDILQKKIENTQFYQCESIALAYDDSGDTISKITFAQEGKFYFTGELRPSRIEPLLFSLCKYLGLRGKERELFVVLTEKDLSAIIDYLKDKEYEVSEIESELSRTPEITGDCKQGENIGKENLILKNDTSTNICNAQRENDENVEKSELAIEIHINTDTDIAKYSEYINDFIGGSYNIEDHRVNTEHVISAYRILQYIKNMGYEFASDFDEKEYVKNGKYNRIKLADGKYINTHGAKWGIWYLSPYEWNDLNNNGDWSCLCVGDGEDDFVLIKSREDIDKFANSTNCLLLRVKGNEINSNSQVLDSLIPSNSDTIGNVQIMVRIHKHPVEDINSIFDASFKSNDENDYSL